MTPKATNRKPKAMQAKSKTHTVAPAGNNAYNVVSGHSGTTYTVEVLADGGATCTCDWGHYRKLATGRRSGCSHTVAVFDHIAKTTGAKSVSAWATTEEAARQHRHTLDIGDGLLLTVRRAA